MMKLGNQLKKNLVFFPDVMPVLHSSVSINFFNLHIHEKFTASIFNKFAASFKFIVVVFDA